jgi:hypothetical protein
MSARTQADLLVPARVCECLARAAPPGRPGSSNARAGGRSGPTPDIKIQMPTRDSESDSGFGLFTLLFYFCNHVRSDSGERMTIQRLLLKCLGGRRKAVQVSPKLDLSVSNFPPDRVLDVPKIRIFVAG